MKVVKVKKKEPGKVTFYIRAQLPAIVTQPG